MDASAPGQWGFSRLTNRANPRSSGVTSNRSTGSPPFAENTDIVTESAWTSMPTQTVESFMAGSSRMWLYRLPDRVKIRPVVRRPDLVAVLLED